MIIETPGFLHEFSGHANLKMLASVGLMQELRSRGKSIILASHHQHDIDLLCDEALRFENGQLTAVQANNTWAKR